MKSVICVLAILFFSFGERVKAEEGKFILLPLPFYMSTTGLGMTVKMMHTNMGATTYVDLTGFGTQKGQLGLMASVGQKKAFFSDLFFWSLSIDEKDVESTFLGTGNHVEMDFESTYDFKIHKVFPTFGVNLGEYLKVYGKYVYSREEVSNFDDPNGVHTEYENSIVHPRYAMKGFGGGLKLEIVDSKVRVTKGVKVSYEYIDFADSPYENIINSYNSMGSVAFYLPYGTGLSHAMRFFYHSVGRNTPFYKNPDIRVRGVEDKRHNDKKSIAFQNEFRIYTGGNWAVIPFFDMGRVMEYDESSSHMNDDLHYGYGIGTRYILKEALVIRADMGFSKNGESSFEFNYQHTF